MEDPFNRTSEAKNGQYQNWSHVFLCKIVFYSGFVLDIFFYLRPPSVVNLTFVCMPIFSVFCRFQRCIHTVLETPVCNKKHDQET